MNRNSNKSSSVNRRRIKNNYKRMHDASENRPASKGSSVSSGKKASASASKKGGGFVAGIASSLGKGIASVRSFFKRIPLFKNKKIPWKAIGLGALVILVVGGIIIAVSSKPKKQEDVPVPSDTVVSDDHVIEENVYLNKTALKGMTLGEAKEVIKERAGLIRDSFRVLYAIDGKEYPITGEELGLTTNVDDIISRISTFSFENADKTSPSAGGTDYVYDLKLVANKTKVGEVISHTTSKFNETPVDAKVEVKKSEDEDKLQTAGKVQYTESRNGCRINTDALSEQVLKSIENGDSGRVIRAEKIILEPDIKLSDIENSLSKMASYSTQFKDSNANRCYNIWKMSTVVNGIRLAPGEEWSINEHAGPRYEKYGWKEAAGIIDGAYTEQFGGGICQVSSTLYNAIVRAELTILRRSHHSWPVAYVPVGMDATISTGDPDLVFSNPYDVPIFIIVNCDAKYDKKITVTVYGPKRDYKVDVKTKEVSNEPPAETVVMKLNPSLSPGQQVTVKQRKNKIVVEAWIYKYDLNTNQQIGDPVLLHTDTYRAMVGEIHYGPSATAKAPATKKPEASPTPASTPIPSLPPAEPGGEDNG